MDKFPNSSSSTTAKERYLNSLGDDYGEFSLGQNTSRILKEDPKLLLFTLSRYKFVSKVLSGRNKVLEIGCQEGWGIPIISKVVDYVLAVDFYAPYIESCERRIQIKNVEFKVYDILNGPLNNEFDGIYALDVLEHIEPNYEEQFMQNIVESMTNEGVLVLGMPSLESQVYASESSRKGHVNCKNGEDFRAFMSKFFEFSLVLSLNDETLHSGFYPMSHYLMAIGAIPRISKAKSWPS